MTYFSPREYHPQHTHICCLSMSLFGQVILHTVSPSLRERCSASVSRARSLSPSWAVFKGEGLIQSVSQSRADRGRPRCRGGAGVGGRSWRRWWSWRRGRSWHHAPQAPRSCDGRFHARRAGSATPRRAERRQRVCPLGPRLGATRSH